MNTVGGQDELVFDGGSLVVAPDGTIACRAAMFDEDLLVVDVDGGRLRGRAATAVAGATRGRLPRARARPAATTSARTASGGRRSGLSGGIDSALVATLAADALGPGAVRALAMPSHVLLSRRASTDAEDVAGRLGIRLRDGSRSTTSSTPTCTRCADVSAAREPGVAEENLQARIRGNH